MSLNKAILIGRLGRDPEVRYMPSGEAVCNFSLATSEKWKAKDGTNQERTEWHNISMFGRLAEIAGQYLKKGALVYLEGKIQTDKYTDKTTGAERYTTKIIAHEMKMLGSKSDSEPNSGSHAPQSAPPKPLQARPAGQVAQPLDDIDDDIPF